MLFWLHAKNNLYSVPPCCFCNSLRCSAYGTFCYGISQKCTMSIKGSMEVVGLLIRSWTSSAALLETCKWFSMAKLITSKPVGKLSLARQQLFTPYMLLSRSYQHVTSSRTSKEQGLLGCIGVMHFEQVRYRHPAGAANDTAAAAGSAAAATVYISTLWSMMSYQGGSISIGSLGKPLILCNTAH